MKNLFFVLIVLCSFSATAQIHTETIKKEINFSEKSNDNLLTVNNINGSITVEGYSGNTILVEVEKTIEGRTQAKLEKGKEEVELGIQEEGNDIIIYNKTPCSEVKLKKSKDGNWRWQTGQNNCHWGNGIDFNFDMKIKVPFDSNISISTVNNGNIKVNQVNGKVKANNINGNISLKKISGKINAHTINGDVDIVYSKNPNQDSKYYTLNGDINLFYKKGLAAKMTFETFQGDFYTDLDNIKMLPTSIEKKEKGKGIKVKIGGKTTMQVKNGNVLLDFETFNGNVYLKEI